MTSKSSQENQGRVTRMMGHALTLCDDARAWDGLSFIMRNHLSGFERACLFVATARSLDPDDRCHVLRELERREGVGMPLPPFFDQIDDATWWASHASIEERKAVLVAAFTSLPARKQGDFLAFANRRSAA